jgi:hypothetical protein
MDGWFVDERTDIRDSLQVLQLDENTWEGIGKTKMEAGGQLGHEVVAVVLGGEPPLYKALDGANVPTNAIGLLRILPRILGSLGDDGIMAEEVVDRVLLLDEWVVLPPEDMNRARTVGVEFPEQASGLVSAHTVEERLRKLESQEAVGAPDAGEQA